MENCFTTVHLASNLGSTVPLLGLVFGYGSKKKCGYFTKQKHNFSKRLKVCAQFSQRANILLIQEGTSQLLSYTSLEQYVISETASVSDIASVCLKHHYCTHMV